jgi:lysozyme
LSEPIDRLREMLIKHEGLRLKPYKCTAGKTTIGVGRNLDDVGISKFEAMQMLAADIGRIQKEAVENFNWFKSISVVRQDVVLSMLFNMGLSRFSGFKNMIAAIVAQNYSKAADEMMNSAWSAQVGIRATELAQMMREGRYL